MFFLNKLVKVCNTISIMHASQYWKHIKVRVSGYRSIAPGFDSRRYQNFCEVVGLKWGALSLVSTIEKLLERKSSGSGLDNR
jgi:hypothetical protein